MAFDFSAISSSLPGISSSLQSFCQEVSKDLKGKQNFLNSKNLNTKRSLILGIELAQQRIEIVKISSLSELCKKIEEAASQLTSVQRGSAERDKIVELATQIVTSFRKIDRSYLNTLESCSNQTLMKVDRAIAVLEVFFPIRKTPPKVPTIEITRANSITPPFIVDDWMNHPATIMGSRSCPDAPSIYVQEVTLNQSPIQIPSQHPLYREPIGTRASKDSNRTPPVHDASEHVTQEIFTPASPPPEVIPPPKIELKLTPIRQPGLLRRCIQNPLFPLCSGIGSGILSILFFSFSVALPSLAVLAMISLFLAIPFTGFGLIWLILHRSKHNLYQLDPLPDVFKSPKNSSA